VLLKLVNRFAEVVAVLPVTNNTLAPAGKVAGAATTCPPPVILAFTLVIQVGSVHIPFQLLFGHVAVRLAVVSGVGPTWKNTISPTFSGVPHASTSTEVISKQVVGVGAEGLD
jgi:hypothetical protein